MWNSSLAHYYPKAKCISQLNYSRILHFSKACSNHVKEGKLAVNNYKFWPFRREWTTDPWSGTWADHIFITVTKNISALRKCAEPSVLNLKQPLNLHKYMFYNVCSSHLSEFLFVDVCSAEKCLLQTQQKETSLGSTQSGTVYQKKDEAKI